MTLLSLENLFRCSDFLRSEFQNEKVLHKQIWQKGTLSLSLSSLSLSLLCRLVFCVPLPDFPRVIFCTQSFFSFNFHPYLFSVPVRRYSRLRFSNVFTWHCQSTIKVEEISFDRTNWGEKRAKATLGLRRLLCLWYFLFFVKLAEIQKIRYR